MLSTGYRVVCNSTGDGGSLLAEEKQRDPSLLASDKYEQRYDYRHVAENIPPIFLTVSCNAEKLTAAETFLSCCRSY